MDNAQKIIITILLTLIAILIFLFIYMVIHDNRRSEAQMFKTIEHTFGKCEIYKKSSSNGTFYVKTDTNIMVVVFNNLFDEGITTITPLLRVDNLKVEKE